MIAENDALPPLTIISTRHKQRIRKKERETTQAVKATSHIN
jgi:hypothetical protein